MFKHFLVVARIGRLEEDDVVAVELFVEPGHHPMHQLVGGRVHLIDVRIVEVVLVLGGEAVEHGNAVRLAVGVHSRQLLRLAGSDNDVHALELGKGEDAVGDIQVVLSVIYLEVDLLVRNGGRTVQCHQEALVEPLG